MTAKKERQVLASTAQSFAMVGMSCLLPGAGDLDRFWLNVLSKVDAIREVPPERWDWKSYYAETPDTRDRITSRWGGFLDPVLFNPMDYGLPPNSVRDVEPLQLVMLEVVRTALRDAGYDNDRLPRARTAIVLGAGGGFGELGQDYAVRAALTGKYAGCAAEEIVRRLPEWNADTFAGILNSMLAGRVASRLNLGGANLTVDAACASSLAAVYMACHELETGGADVVITGGADFCQNPFYYFCFDKTHALSPQGRCRAFDRAADGTTLGEGVVALVLKRLADAERDGDRIYAVIKGMAASSDGRGTGLTAPHVKGQVLALERAYLRAGCAPATVGLVEAHGTGTVAGDRCEVRALKRVWGAAGATPASVALGSVKSMIGHTKSAAGVAGLLKAALALHHRVLPPTLGVEQPNPSLAGGPLYVNTEARPWIGDPDQLPRRAGVNAFGFGGANYHAVLEEYPACASAAATRLWPSELFLWKAADAGDLAREVQKILEDLNAGAQPALRDLAFTLWRHARSRRASATLSIVAASRDVLLAALDKASRHLAKDAGQPLWDPVIGVYFTPRPLAQVGHVAFLFPGQGSQYPDMLRELAVYFHEVRDAFAHADLALAGRFPQALSRSIFPPPRFGEDAERAARLALATTNLAQPALGAAALGLLALLRNLGVAPRLVAGHSYGEYAALCAAGCFSPDQLIDLSEARGRFIIEEAKGDLGTMAAVTADETQTHDLLGDVPDLWIANLNAPRQTIISGTQAAVTEALQRLETRHVDAQPIPVSCAFHSPLVAPAKERLKARLAETPFAAPRLRVFANSTGTEYPPDPAAGLALLGEHLVSPVRFVSQIEAMYAAGARVFVEIGPRSVLTGLTEQILEGRTCAAISLESRQRTGLGPFLHALAQLAAQGLPIALERLFAGREPRELNLNRLVEETRAVAPPPTAWWVAGGRASPVFAAVQPDEIPRPAAAPAPARLPTPASPPSALTDHPPHAPATAPAAPFVPNPTASPSPGGPAVDELLRMHEQVVAAVLATHQRVMQAALGHAEGRTAPAPRANPPATPSSHANEQEKYIRAALSVPDVTPALQPAAIETDLLAIVAERTGYPLDMLNLDIDLEADLGIDSIKRTEIVGRLRRKYPQLKKEGANGKREALATLRTLRKVRDWAQRQLADTPPAETDANLASADGTANGASDARHARHDVMEATPPAPAAMVTTRPATIFPERDVFVPRFVLREFDLPALEPSAALPAEATFLITDDGRGLAESVAREIVSVGSRAIVLAQTGTGPADGKVRYEADFNDVASLRAAMTSIRKRAGRIAGLIHLLPLRDHPPVEELDLAAWRRMLQQEVKSLFFLAQAAAEDLKMATTASPAWIVAGVADGERAFPSRGGIMGLVNALASEWPGTAAKVLAIGTEPTLIQAQHIVAELRRIDGERYVALRGGRRVAVQVAAAELDRTAKPTIQIGSDAVILLTGGARGITAEIAQELAARFQPTLVLVGRSPWPEDAEASATREAHTPEALRRAIAAQLSRPHHKKATLAKIESAYRELMQQRDMRATADALHQAGARVQYEQADVRDAAALNDVIERIHQQHGRLDGVIHGAGVIEDRSVEDKTPESFDRVFDTKADSAFVLTQHSRLAAAKFIVFFSSTAFLGSAGQSDYAAGNGMLNALAQTFDRRRPGRMTALLWGPWESAGMASNAVQNQLRERGVQIIPPAAGRRCLVDELRFGRKGEVEVLFGNAPYSSPPNQPNRVGAPWPLVNLGQATTHPDGSVDVSLTLNHLANRATAKV